MWISSRAATLFGTEPYMERTLKIVQNRPNSNINSNNSSKNNYNIHFEILTVVLVRNSIFWVVSLAAL
jgi:hypothetical protein